jgi:hypothetical protein
MDVEYISDGYKIIVRFFKEIGLYREFKEYCHWCNKCKMDTYNFKTYKQAPLSNFGSTKITRWLKNERNIELKDKNLNLYEYFKAWIFTFYPNYYDVNVQPYKNALKTINKEKRTIKIEFIKK